jgi:peptide/nickel transport system permease protein
MKRAAGRVALRALRVLSLVALAMLGTMALMRFAPGYFSDAGEMDAQYSSVAREQMRAQEVRESSFVKLVAAQMKSWAHGDLGRSRQFDTPVTELLRERTKTTAKLLVVSVLSGWMLALLLAVPLSLRRAAGGEALVGGPVALLLAVPVSAMATACLVANLGGPALVLALLIAVRDFKLVYSLLRRLRATPQIVYARAQGFSTIRIVRTHLLTGLAGELGALAMTSFVLALSACVPVEVIFDLPGLGQLAWNAAMNRDLPVLLAVTLLRAGSIAVAAMFTDSREGETTLCA